MESTPLLPTNCTFEYLAEGAANVVYRIRLDDPATASPSTEADLHSLPDRTSQMTPPPSDLSPPGSPNPQSADHALLALLKQSRPPLLRLKKALPHLPKIKAQYGNYVTEIAPLLPATSMVDQTLVQLPKDLTNMLNRELHAFEENGRRPARRQGTYLAEDELHGLLVEDMSSDLSLELKPKWLAQSPTAPTGAQRCRTCALRVQRVVQKKQSQADGYCPLDLVSHDHESVKRAVVKILASQSTMAALDRDRLLGLITTFLLSFDTLDVLQDLQTRLDPHGVLSLDDSKPVPDDFLKATTIRDCTLFLRVDAGDAVVGKLGDLDLKAPEEGKLRYWKDIERGLLEGGFYQGKDGLRSGCRLER